MNREDSAIVARVEAALEEDAAVARRAHELAPHQAAEAHDEVEAVAVSRALRGGAEGEEVPTGDEGDRDHFRNSEDPLIKQFLTGSLDGPMKV